MGIFQRIVNAIRRVFSGAEVEEVERPPAAPPPPPSSPLPPGWGGSTGTIGAPSPPAAPGPSGDDFGQSDEWGLPGVGDVDFDFALAGFMPMGGRGDDYVNMEGAGSVNVSNDIPWTDVDYVVVHVVEPDGTDYYTSIVGPFDDYDDFFDHLQSWWEEGSP